MEKPSASLPDLNFGSWDPTRPSSSTNLAPSAEARRRVFNEVREFYDASLCGIYFAPDESDISKFHAIIVGPKDTPYEGGFLYFYLGIPPNYPWSPPQVKLMTTGSGQVRFNPNLYANGRVCLSILGTWTGPGWSPSMTLQSVLLSIQTLMSDEPYFNEPAYEGKQQHSKHKKLSKEYNDEIRFQTQRVAILDMVEGTTVDMAQLTQVLKDKIAALFIENFSSYESIISKNVVVSSPKTDYVYLVDRLRKIRQNMEF